MIVQSANRLSQLQTVNVNGRVESENTGKSWKKIGTMLHVLEYPIFSHYHHQRHTSMMVIEGWERGMVCSLETINILPAYFSTGDEYTQNKS